MRAWDFWSTCPAKLEFPKYELGDPAISEWKSDEMISKTQTLRGNKKNTAAGYREWVSERVLKPRSIEKSAT